MLWEIIISGIGLGLISSFHCIGMCGPLVFALPIQHLPASKRLLGAIIYHLGRVLTYTALGVFFGFVGKRFFVAGFQQMFSIILGVLILLMLVSFVLNKRFLHFTFIDKTTAVIQEFIIKHMQRKSFISLFSVGAANGLLPCGMVYFAIAGSMATGNIEGGSFFMLAFGLGTLPFMVLLSQFGYVLNIAARNTMKKTVPFFIAGMGILLILRGLNLGIPYVSPHFDNTAATSVSCH
jgi:sulfite exporter TauE/SafE